jgi:type IV secretion system protein TrbL
MEMNGLMTTLLHQLETVFVTGITNVTPLAKHTAGLVITVDFMFSIFKTFESDASFIWLLVRGFIKYGGWIFLLDHYKTLVYSIINSFVTAGWVAGGMAIPKTALTDPSYVIDLGGKMAENIYSFTATQASVSSTIAIIAATLSGELTIAKLFPNFFYFGCYLGVNLAFFIIAWQLFVTYAEMFLIAALVPVLLPFGAWDKTSFITEKAIGCVISFGVKLMVLFFILTASIPLINLWTVPTNPTNKDCLILLSGCWALTFLCWNAPSMVSTLMGGGPTLTSGSVAGAAMAATAAVAGATMAGTSILKTGGSTLGSVARGIAGMSGGAGGKEGALAKATGALATATTTDSGGSSIGGSNSGGSGGSNDSSTGGGFSGDNKSNSAQNSTSSPNTIAQFVAQVKQSIPPEASSSAGGFHAPIKHD